MQLEVEHVWYVDSGQLVDSLEGDFWFWGVACGGNGYSGSG